MSLVSKYRRTVTNWRDHLKQVRMRAAKKRLMGCSTVVHKTPFEISK